jgi:glutamyl-tRNA(Gln) amidotransferase subunit E
VKAGLEVHQQLATRKLFCACPSELSELASAVVERRLRATGGERVAVDPAAAFQSARSLVYRYEVVPSASCLVELDEEPPHMLNPEALEVALTMALLLRARPLDEIEVMRKIVVDGSNTSGFQRTTLIAVDGSLEVDGRTYSIPTVCLEEDAARKTGESDGGAVYRLDRLGIPLIEIATGPEITRPEEAQAVAAEIGALLRSTGRVRRGVGTIREDLNVSTEGGTRIEIKGVQELRLIHRYVELEDERQRTFLELRDRLRASGASAPAEAVVDLAEVARRAATGPLQGAVRANGAVLGLRLPGYAGHLGSGRTHPVRLGRELADYARTAGVGGILHSDEGSLPGVDAEMREEIRRRLHLEERDAFVIVAAPSLEVGELALERVRERAAWALEGIPPETRDPLPDGRTRYSRPLPGRDRMYPETDVPPVVVSDSELDRLRAHLPPSPREERERLRKDHGLNAELARRLQDEGAIAEFEALVARGHAPATVARLLAQELPTALAAAPGPLRPVPVEVLDETLAAVERREFAKEGIAAVLERIVQHGESVAEAIRSTGLAGGGSVDLDRVVAEVVRRNEALVRERGLEALSPLMGDVMREVRGRRDGKEVAEALRRALRQTVGSSASSAA